jgi:uridine phosphorylase
LAYLNERGFDSAALAVAPTIVAAWGPLAAPVARSAGARRGRRRPYDGEWPYHAANGLGVVQLPTGGPAAALLLDQLVACGARVIITAGIAGSLVPEVPPGTVVLAADAICGDGTSQHYAAPAGSTVAGSPEIVATLEAGLGVAGLDVRTGTVWTTDAPFRETSAVVARARIGGAIAMDMETAAVYALAISRGIAACAVLVLTDGVWDGWRPAFGTPAVQRALKAVACMLPGAARACS